MPSTIALRLAMEAEADALADAAAEALERWRSLSEQRHALELALRELPDIVPATQPLAAQAA